MRIFLTGANGWVGSRIADDMIAAGHHVAGLVRSGEKADAVAARGVTPVIGTLDDLDVMRAAATDADAIVHTAFGLDFSRIAELAEQERGVLETFATVFEGSDRPIVVTSGVGIDATGAVFTEGMRRPVLPSFPRASEQIAFALAERGIDARVVRLPRSVHGKGERHGFVPMLSAVARDKGVSAYVGDGGNRWPAVHRLDAARVYRLAIERGARGAAYHAIAEEGVPFRLIAEAIGRQLGVPARSNGREEADAHFGALAVWVAGGGPASSAETRATLGWTPTHEDIVADIERPDYSA